MIASMTAFAQDKVELPWGTSTWEVRSVNHRYLEINFKLPDAFKNLEIQLKDVAKKYLKRGKIDCMLKLAIEDMPVDEVRVNTDLVKQLVGAARNVQSHIDANAELVNVSVTAFDILQWPGVVKTDKHDLTENQAQIIQAFETALQQLVGVRQREGGQLAELIKQRIAGMQDVLKTVKSSYPKILAAQQKKLKTKISELEVKLDEDRLEQELVYLAQKTDVAEEIERYSVHLDEVARVIQSGGLVGRRLDFLMQELNREANTMGSKSIDSITSQAAIELKVLIEQVREQIQNLE